MTSNSSDSTNVEVESWLQNFLKKEQLSSYSISILNTHGKNGFFSDVVYVKVSATTKEGQPREYFLVLKASFTNEILRNTHPVKETYENEDYMYREVLPAFIEFQKSKGISEKDVLHCWPQYFGSFMSENREAIILENLRNSDYDLWNRRSPVSREALDLLLENLAKFHAISLALNDQQPEKFKEISSPLKDLWYEFNKDGGMTRLFQEPIENSFEVLEDVLEPNIFEAWKRFHKEVVHLFGEMIHDTGYPRSVIAHGDCWKNNVMFKVIDGHALDVKFLDFQVSQIAHPVMDVSSLLYTCISPKDIEDFGEIIQLYHKNLGGFIEKLGSNPEKLYPIEKFLKDWKNYGKFGLSKLPISMKVYLAQAQDLPDESTVTEHDGDLSKMFTKLGISDSSEYLKRVVPIIKHAYEFGMIS